MLYYSLHCQILETKMHEFLVINVLPLDLFPHVAFEISHRKKF